MSEWYLKDKAQVVRELGTDEALGLSAEEADLRLAKYGLNELEERGSKSPWRILWEQLTASMVIILILAAVISAFLGDLKDAAAILIIVILNAFLGFRQEYKAEKAMAALKALAVPTVRVVRCGALREVSARELVAGDIVVLEAGNLVPADGRLVESSNLRVQEAALTGESEPVEKDADFVAGGEVLPADRRNMAYMGTIVTYGRGRMVVTETGMRTELGRIASMIQKVKTEVTPLQRRLNQLGQGLAAAALALIAVIFSLGLLRGGDIKEMFLIAISMAVAAVPEGLPAVVTIALALGSQRMLRRRALIRKLPAVETLGSVTVICSDKTGTLTQNRMTVSALDVGGYQLDLTGNNGTSLAHTSAEGVPKLDDQPSSIVLLLVGGALCNDAFLESGGSGGAGGEWHLVGDPTETAIIRAAAQMGIWKSSFEEILPRVAEVPFDSDRKRMTTIHRFEVVEHGPAGILNRLISEILGLHGASHVAFTKGAVDSVLKVCDRVIESGRIERMDGQAMERIFAANDRLAQKGMRVLGLAYRPLQAFPLERAGDGVEQELIFVGMIAMIDPARPEVKDAVATCKAAGIRPVMITGDHPLTARYIARDLGILNGETVITGGELERLSIEEIEEIVDDVSVYARVSPEHKLNIVQALKNRNHIVAMTGDGVNDAPALKKADIGVAMGITGTDVTKEVADMVLLDDNFATIVAAVEEGRVIYDNIRRFIKYLLTTNSGEIWVMLLAPFLGMPLPLLPLQILWINLVTDGLPALALGVEPGERDVMRRPPYKPDENIFGRGMGWHILWVGFLMGTLPLIAGFWQWRQNHPGWQTMVFTVLTFAQMSHAMAIRSARYSLFTIGLLSNKSLLGAVVLTSLMQLAVVYIPFLQEVFGTRALSLSEMAWCIGLSTLVFWAVEMEKWIIRMRAGSEGERPHAGSR